MIKKSVVTVCVLLLVATIVFGQGALIERYFDAANENLTKREYKKSFDYINYVLSQYPTDKTPQNVELLAENVYYSYLEEIRDTRDMDAFGAVKDKLLEYEFLTTERISRIVRVINTLESQDTSWGAIQQSEPRSGTAAASVAAAAAEKEAEYKKKLEAANNELAVLEKVLKMAREDKEKDEETALLAEQKRIESQKELYEAALSAMTRTAEANNSLLYVIVLATVGLVVLIFIIVLIVSAVNVRHAKKQQKQFEATMEMVARIAHHPGQKRRVTGLPDIYDDDLRSAGSSKLGSVALPQPEMSEEEQEELKQLALNCEKIGLEIDIATGRKNNSKNVAELVFKLSHELQLGAFDASLYFCAAMVYDAGFLQIEPSLLKAGKLTDEERIVIRDHVKKGLERLDFLPDRYKPVFKDAILMHHENMDGTGYPDGLSGEEIPIVARLIHVAESFVALISRRNYRGISDKESAVEELKSRPNLYDPEIVRVLDSII